VFLALACSGLPSAALGHHSAVVTYDITRTVEFEGIIAEVQWRNPHLHIVLNTVGGDRTGMQLDVESIPATRLRRVGLAPELFEVGATVRVAGFPSRRYPDQMYANNLLLPDGREVLLDSPQPYWTNDTIGIGLDITPGERGADRALGLFRVWSTDGKNFRESPESLLTERARAAREEWDPFAADNPFLGCTPKGMPGIMGQPNPIEFVDRGEQIVIRLEEFDTVRVVSMGEPPQRPEPPTLLGHSYGRWDGDSLVVETRDIDYRYFSQDGLLQSPAMHVVERFTLNAEGSRLDYEQTVTDAWLLQEPFTRTKSWVWVPGDRVLPFECTG
jgi:hypothetical protein